MCLADCPVLLTGNTVVLVWYAVFRRWCFAAYRALLLCFAESSVVQARLCWTELLKHCLVASNAAWLLAVKLRLTEPSCLADDPVLVFCASRQQTQSCAELLAELLPSQPGCGSVSGAVGQARNALVLQMQDSMGGFSNPALEKLMLAGKWAPYWCITT